MNDFNGSRGKAYLPEPKFGRFGLSWSMPLRHPAVCTYIRYRYLRYFHRRPDRGILVRSFIRQAEGTVPWISTLISSFSITLALLIKDSTSAGFTSLFT